MAAAAAAVIGSAAVVSVSKWLAVLIHGQLRFQTEVRKLSDVEIASVVLNIGRRSGSLD